MHETKTVCAGGVNFAERKYERIFAVYFLLIIKLLKHFTFLRMNISWLTIVQENLQNSSPLAILIGLLV